MTTRTEDTNDNVLWKECKQYVICDGGDCKERNPANRCSRCHTVYYCSKDCQRKHWKAHKEECVPVDQMRESLAGLRKASESITQIEPDPKTVQKVLESSSECGICLESNMARPIVLAGCHHVFCFGCLKQWNDAQARPVLRNWGDLVDDIHRPARPQKPTCPLCRQSMPNISKTTIENALHLMATAGTKKDTAPDECKDLCNQAIAQVDLMLLSSSSSSGNDQKICNNLSVSEQLQIATIKGEAAILCNDFESAIHLFQDAAPKLEAAVERRVQIEKLLQKREQIRDEPEREDELNKLEDQIMRLNAKEHVFPGEHIGVVLKVGQSQRLAKEWEDAKATYMGLFERYITENETELTPQQTRELFTSLSECAYQMGDNHLAIQLGKDAIEMNRHFPWSHKVVALAKKKNGDLEAAKQTAAEAVVYEAPWDEKHKANVQEWYKENFQ